MIFTHFAPVSSHISIQQSQTFSTTFQRSYRSLRLLSTPIHSQAYHIIIKGLSDFSPFCSSASGSFRNQTQPLISVQFPSPIILSHLHFVYEHNQLPLHHCVNDHPSCPFSSSIILSHQHLVDELSLLLLSYIIIC